MSDESLSLQQMLEQDARYPLDAYVFVRDALSYASDVLNLGSDSLHEPSLEFESPSRSRSAGERHLTGQELCEAIRLYAINQFGYMAKTVLNNWGITCTNDFGNIVFNMINVGLMKKSQNDRREHFDNVYEFSDVFERRFELKLSRR